MPPTIDQSADTDSASQFRQVFEQFDQICDEQDKLCSVLEEIADSLPDDVDRQQCIHVARAMVGLIKRAHTFEEHELFSRVEQAVTLSTADAHTLERLKFEHYEDECFAEEVYEALMACGTGSDRLSADALGYMLRGFFISLRRHMAFEKELVRTHFGLAS